MRRAVVVVALGFLALAPSIAAADGAADACVPVAASVQSDGSVIVTWGSGPGAEGHRLYRSVGDGAFALLASSTPDHPHYTDETARAVAPSTRLAYVVTVVVDGEESALDPACATEVAAVPVFGATFAVVLGAVGAVATLVLARRA